MDRISQSAKDLTDLDALIDEITVDCDDDDHKLWAFLEVLTAAVALPADGFVIGEPVSITKIDYDGNQRLGLTAICHRQEGSEHIVAVSDVVFPEGSVGARHIAAYRQWLNPTDNQGVRFLIEDVKAKRPPWEQSETVIPG